VDSNESGAVDGSFMFTDELSMAVLDVVYATAKIRSCVAVSDTVNKANGGRPVRRVINVAWSEVRPSDSIEH
jgi:hypothetical protein